jgi:MoCo/4Fe-4S cofactor protein with predicted Tat translocation signal
MTEENNDQKQKMDLKSIRKRLAQGDKDLWRSLDELAETEEFLEYLEDEFPQQVRSAKGLDRRDFLKLMAASLGLAGLTACMPRENELIMPYTQAPAELMPGRPMVYASAYEMDGYARGILVNSHMGRPIKIEGNPDHPASLGASDPFMQASILEMYNPDRSEVITSGGRIRTWAAFHSDLRQAISIQAARQGGGFRLLTRSVSSPTLAFQIEQLLEAFPGAQWIQYDPISRDNIRQGAEIAFGEPVETTYDFNEAEVILSLDSNFLYEEPGSIAYTRAFGARRTILEGQINPNRLYAVEGSFTITGASADHRLRVRPSQVESAAFQIAQMLGVGGLGAPQGPQFEFPEGWLEALVQDLEENAGNSLVIAGMRQPPEVHALAHAINQALGNTGNTVFHIEPVLAAPINQMEALENLVQDMNAGNVELLVMIDSNPVYDTPANLDFIGAMQQVELSVYLGLYDNETAIRSTYHVPAAHFLEMWSDSRAYDGTISIIQPLIEPIFGGMSPHELLAELMGQTGVRGHDIVRGFWQEEFGAADAEDPEFDLWWRQALHDGLLPDSASPVQELSLIPGWQSRVSSSIQRVSSLPQETQNELEIVFEPDPTMWDGRFANNAWLHELPKPITKLVWDNAALIGPATAERLDVLNLDVIQLNYQNRVVNAPVWVMPGLAEGVVLVHLGYGRRRGGQIMQGTGFSGYTLRTTDTLWFGTGLLVRPTGDRYSLVSTQIHHSMEGRDLVLRGTAAEFEQDPDFLHAGGHYGPEPPSLYPEWPYDGHAWGMAINLSACTGCNACVIACQAENNIPVVGKDQVGNSREMHWLRIDTYFEGGLDDPEVHFQPLPCMHCEKAPCEPVCPVAATVHSAEGLNEMVYNRCIGTRYCSNNCPYKVRRFNFLQYSEDAIPLQLMHNPEVSVRSRGVMEKCTYCVQRINQARITAKKENRRIQPNEVMTACQQACPANAIVFGDINNPEDPVTHLKEQPHNYGLLAHLGVQPRTTYLADLDNPNPQMGGGGEAA